MTPPCWAKLMWAYYSGRLRIFRRNSHNSRPSKPTETSLDSFGRNCKKLLKIFFPNRGESLTLFSFVGKKGSSTPKSRTGVEHFFRYLRKIQNSIGAFLVYNGILDCYAADCLPLLRGKD